MKRQTDGDVDSTFWKFHRAATNLRDVSSPNWQWFVVGRWQEFAGESRANLLRIVAVGAFYLVDLINFHFIGKGAEGYVALHRIATTVAVAWTLLALAALLCLRRQIFPPAMKYLTTATDIILLTCLGRHRSRGAGFGATDGAAFAR